MFCWSRRPGDAPEPSRRPGDAPEPSRRPGDAPEPSRRPGAHPGHRNRIPMALELLQAIGIASQWLWSFSRPSESHPNGSGASPGHREAIPTAWKQIFELEDNGIFFKNAQSAAAVAYGETVVLKEVVFQLIFSVSEKYQQPITTASVKESIPDVTKSLTKTYKPVVDILQRFHASIEKFEKAFVLRFKFQNQMRL
ncbi:hypothetical protein H4Q26_016693 [Puccinia striiformis f. sp. tritici PST-130]|nr:hypothetical protein H4Q26_016693 [Puccinia striiformis f. sp. tritici PST-130]